MRREDIYDLGTHADMKEAQINAPILGKSVFLPVVDYRLLFAEILYLLSLKGPLSFLPLTTVSLYTTDSFTIWSLQAVLSADMCLCPPMFVGLVTRVRDFPRNSQLSSQRSGAPFPALLYGFHPDGRWRRVMTCIISLYKRNKTRD